MINGLFCSEFFTDHFPGLGFFISGPTYAKIGLKLLKIAQNPGKMAISGKTEVISRKRKWPWDWKLNSDPEKVHLGPLLRDFYSELKKMTIYGSIFGGQNQKNGHSSLPEAPNAKPNTDSESTSKNTSKKIGLKKVFITPTQNIGDFRFLTNLSLCSLVLAMKMIDSIGSMISRAKGHGSCLSAPDFSISVPVSRKLTPK